MQMTFDTITIYFRRSTGEFVADSDEHADLADKETPFDNRPEWEQEAFQIAGDVLTDKVGDYVQLPSRYDIHESSIMADFCRTIENPRLADDLFRSISGKGAFRRFKDAICRHSIEQAWNKFKDEAYKGIAKEWCEENGIIWSD